MTMVRMECSGCESKYMNTLPPLCLTQRESDSEERGGVQGSFSEEDLSVIIILRGEGLGDPREQRERIRQNVVVLLCCYRHRERCMPWLGHSCTAVVSRLRE